MGVLSQIKRGKSKMLAFGNHTGVIQSVLDFDYMTGKGTPSIVGIVASNRKSQKYFFGPKEILIPCFASASALSPELKKEVSWMLNLQSGRRSLSSTIAFFESIPHALGGHIFAENVPEKHSAEINARFAEKYFLVGPSGVGFLVPGQLKLGAIGGIDPHQISAGKLATKGNIAVGSTSGGMTNELIRAVVGAGRRVSFAIAIGGDRFPILSLTEVFLLAEEDKDTEAFVYFGELGGVDEYEIIELIKAKRFTKPLVAYIAGVIDEAFDDHVQFGHAKALVAKKDESARAKREALRAHGAIVPDTFPEFLEALKDMPKKRFTDPAIDAESLMRRKKSILSTRKLIDLEETPVYISKGKPVSKSHAFVGDILAVVLGKPIRSTTTLAFAEAVCGLLIDHGGHVSGAVNTMIAARAGKDMVSSLSAGLLTIGPRFGGAVNTAAGMWLWGVGKKKSAREFVEEMNQKGELIPGIGHRKYRVGLPDPRVKALQEFATLIKKHPHYDFARGVENITTGKNGSLILNIDGMISALFLDILAECEGYSAKELGDLVDVEAFNAFFVIPRAVGFIGHFLEQKRNDEGLFRLPDDLLFETD